MKYPILFVDDNINWLTVYRKKLPQGNYTIESTTSLLYAFEQIRKFPYPVIISDFRLTGFEHTGGFRLLNEVKKNNQFTKVIIITPYGSEETSMGSMAIEKGAYNFLTKPVNLGELDECITTAVNCWEQEIEECISLGYLRMDYISKIFNASGRTPDANNEINPDTTKVFICCAQCDTGNAHMIAEILKKNGIPLWFDRKQTGFGGSVFDRMNEAMKENAIMLIMLSKKAIDSEWKNKEHDAVFHQYVEDEKLKVILLLLDHAGVPPLLAGRKALDLTTNVHDKITELIDMIKQEEN